MAFSRFYITEKGQDYIAKAQTGKILDITKAQIGSGYLPEGASITAMTALVTPLQDLPIADCSSSGATTTIKAQFTNQKAGGGFLNPFWWAEVGLFAKIVDDPDCPEALIAYENALDQAHADYIPGTLTQFVFNFVLNTENASNVTAEITSGLIFLLETSDLKNNVVTFTEASTRTAPTSGDSEATLWGKIKKLFTDLKSAAYTESSDYATAAQGAKADGSIQKNTATAADQALVSSGSGTWVAKTLVEIKAWLGLGSAASKTAGSASGNVPVNGAALGTTANVPVVTDTSGNLVPHASGALGTAAFKTAGDFQTPTNSLPAETEMDDGDYMPYYDTSSAGGRKTLWSNIKAVLKTYFDTIYSKSGHKHTASEITDFNAGVENDVAVSANTNARHTHSNKTILDNTTASYTTTEQAKLAGIVKGSASGNVPVNGAALGATANVPVVTDTNGNLVPHTSGALGTAAFKSIGDFQTPTSSLTAETVIDDGDYLPYYDISATAHKKTLWSNMKSVLKNYFDSIYSASGHSHMASNITDFDTEVTNNNTVSANTSARHTHSNKAVLDNITASYTTGEQTKLAGINKGSANGNVPVNGAALGTTANVPVVTNTSGNLVPHASGALGSAAFKSISDFSASGHTHAISQITGAGVTTTANTSSTSGSDGGSVTMIDSITTDGYGRVTAKNTKTFTLASARVAILTGLSTATNAIIAATDSILTALGKLQAQITANLLTLKSHATEMALHKQEISCSQTGNSSNAMGYQAVARGVTAYAEGYIAFGGINSHAEGLETMAVVGHAYTVTAVNNSAKTITLDYVDRLSVGNNVDISCSGYGVYVSIQISAINGLVVTLNTSIDITHATYVVKESNDGCNASHVEGNYSIASGSASHAEGQSCLSTSNYSHSEGHCNSANGDSSHAEGSYTRAQGSSSHAEGCVTVANGMYSHAGGDNSTANGNDSFVHGRGLTTNGEQQAVFGRYNEPNNYDLFQVGGGTSNSARSNALRVDNLGNLFTSGDVMASGIGGSVIADAKHTIEEHWSEFNVGVTNKSMWQGTCSYAFIGKTSNVYGAVFIMQYATPPLYGYINEGTWTWHTLAMN